MTERLTSEAQGLFAVLRQSADPETVAEIERFVAEARDRDLCRVNVIDFAAVRRLDEEQVGEEITLDTLELSAGEKAQLSLQLPAEFLILFEPVTHAAQFIDVKGEPTRERQNLSVVFNNLRAPTGTVAMRPGPLRLSLEDRTETRVLPAIWIAGDALHALLAQRRPFLTAKRLLTNQTFRDIYRTDTIDPHQRLKITSLTFLFTDLKGSTE